MRRFLGSFFGDRRGNVAIIFALSLIPITMLVGASVDLSRMRVERTKLQSAVDAAALAAAQMPAGASDDAVDAMINNFLTANFDGEGALAIPVIERNGTNVQISATSNLPMMFGGLFGMNTRPVSTSTGAARGGVNIEVALVLDVTGSMAGTRIEDLKVAANELIDTVVQTTQPPAVDYYTRMAIVPYSTAVNVGARADTLRGAPPAGLTISNITWAMSGTERTITGITRANQGVVTTSGNHGYDDGHIVWIVGVNGMTQINGGPYTVDKQTNTTFKLKNSSGAYIKTNAGGWGSYSSNPNQGVVARCASTDCRVTITTATAHGFDNGDYIAIDDLVSPGSRVNDLTPMNRDVHAVANRTSTTFVASGATPVGFYATTNPTSRGSIYCTDLGCQYYRFTRRGGGTLTYELDTCVTERTGSQRYTAATPSSAFLGRHYVANPDSSDCPTAEIMPMSSNLEDLHGRIDSLATEGGTAGHIGVAWAWYMLSSNFNAALPNNAAVSGAEPPTLKIAVIMTDGEFNTAYCNGVQASNYGGIISCNATNGAPFTQAAALCNAMEAEGILIYTVGFGIDEGSTAGNFMENCASDDSYAYLAATGDQLSAAFGAIGTSISELRLTQ